MSKNVQTTTSGVGFFGLLTIVLVVLKALGYITWSWWIVFMPIIVSTVLVLVVLAFVLILLIAFDR